MGVAVLRGGGPPELGPLRGRPLAREAVLHSALLVAAWRGASVREALALACVRPPGLRGRRLKPAPSLACAVRARRRLGGHVDVSGRVEARGETESGERRSLQRSARAHAPKPQRRNSHAKTVALCRSLSR
eukprot:764124-Prymnesium_polylepis.2